MVKKRKVVEQAASVEEPVVIEAAPLDHDLQAMLEEVKSCDGVIGYIARNKTSAFIDLKDPEKIVDYALFSSLTSETSNTFSELFGLGNIESTLIDGKELKMLSTCKADNRISIFLEKNADIGKVKSKLHIS